MNEPQRTSALLTLLDAPDDHPSVRLALTVLARDWGLMDLDEKATTDGIRLRRRVIDLAKTNEQASSYARWFVEKTPIARLFWSIVAASGRGAYTVVSVDWTPSIRGRRLGKVTYDDVAAEDFQTPIALREPLLRFAANVEALGYRQVKALIDPDSRRLPPDLVFKRIDEEALQIVIHRTSN